MKKIFGIMLALVLVLSLSLVTATSVVADVHALSVIVDADTVGTEAEYTIAFNITKTLAIGATVSIEFPANTTVPTTYEDIDVTVREVAVSHGDINVSGRVVTITLPMGIGAATKVTVVFKETAGITNPTTHGDYTLRVRTSQEPNWVTSGTYTIRLSDKSTYEFVYEVPEMIWIGYPVEVDVTLQTRVLGLGGYDHVRVEFWKEGPGNVIFEAWDEVSQQWYSFTNGGFWGPDDGFPVAADYTATTPFKLTFDTVGVYTIVLQLLDRDDGDKVLVRDDVTVAAAGVSVDVALNKGWNLISLPIVPDDSAIGVVLADVMDNVISVWYCDPAADWRSYTPGVPSDLPTMEDGKAYWINMEEADTLTVVGVAIALPWQMPKAYNVVAGWNMVGFKSMDTMAAGEYLEGTDWVRIYKFEAGGWGLVQSAHNMTPGLGYWVAFSEAGTIYP